MPRLPTRKAQVFLAKRTENWRFSLHWLALTFAFSVHLVLVAIGATMVVVFLGLWRDDFQTMAAEVEVAVGGVLARSRSVCLVWASGCLVPARPIAKFEF